MSGEAGGVGPGVVETFLRLWHVALAPASAALGAFFWRWIERRDKGVVDRRSDQEKRGAAFAARFDRLDARDQEAFRRSEIERDRAIKRGDDADARADAAERERWRMELWVRDFEHALANARQIADDARAQAGQARVEWKSVPRPKLPGDA